MGEILKFSKKTFAFLRVFSLFAGLALLQTAWAQALPDESTIPIGDAPALANGAALPQATGASTVWIFFKMVFVLIAVVAVIYLALSFVRKKMSGGAAQDDDMFLRKVAQVSVAPGKTVQIVTLLEHAYLIGVTDSSIDLLGEITDKELVDAMNLNADRNQATARARNFGDILSVFLNPKNPGATEGERKASSSIDKFFSKQKEKFNGK